MKIIDSSPLGKTIFKVTKMFYNHLDIDITKLIEPIHNMSCLVNFNIYDKDILVVTVRCMREDMTDLHFKGQFYYDRVQSKQSVISLESRIKEDIIVLHREIRSNYEQTKRKLINS